MNDNVQYRPILEIFIQEYCSDILFTLHFVNDLSSKRNQILRNSYPTVPEYSNCLTDTLHMLTS